MAASNTTSSSFEQQLEQYNLKIVEKYSAFDYGPLNFHEPQSKHSNNFRGASYYMVMPKSGNGVMLHRLFGGKAPADGQYFTLEPREASLATRFDLALFNQWNTMERAKNLWIPEPCMFFVGYAASQSIQNNLFNLHGGALQAFVPSPFLKHLNNVQTNDKLAQFKAIQNCANECQTFLKNYTNEVNEKSRIYLNNFISSRDASGLLKNGNFSSGIPLALRNGLSKSGQTMTSSDSRQMNAYLNKSYKVHTERVHLPNGKDIVLTLSFTIRYDGATTRTYKNGNTTVNETTHKYTYVYTWS